MGRLRATTATMGGGDRNGAQLLDERYRLIEQLGAGGMSVVWRGYDEVLGRQVAVKVLASRLASDRAFRHRIRVEAQAAARLCHPNITNVYDYGESQQVGLTVPYVVMELVDGGPLAAGWAGTVRLPWREAVTIGAEVGLGAGHRARPRGRAPRRHPRQRHAHRDRGEGGRLRHLRAGRGEREGAGRHPARHSRLPRPGAAGQRPGLPGHRRVRRRAAALPDADRPAAVAGQHHHRRCCGRTCTATRSRCRRCRGCPTRWPTWSGRCLAKQPADRPATAEVARTLAEAAGMLAAVPVSPAAGQRWIRPRSPTRAPRSCPGRRRPTRCRSPAYPQPQPAPAGQPPSTGGGRGGRRGADRGHRCDVGVHLAQPGQRRGPAHDRGPDGAADAGAVRGRRTRCAPTPARTSPPS